MATATAKERVTKFVESVTLELSLEEAQTLVGIDVHIGGSSSSSRRRHTTAIAAALRTAGIRDTGDDVSRCLWFEDEK